MNRRYVGRVPLLVPSFQTGEVALRRRVEEIVRRQGERSWLMQHRSDGFDWELQH